MRRLTPSFREKLWGATNLAPWFPNAEKRIGEVWFETDALPVLVKFLFTTEKLSVQVHPGDDYAQRHHQSRGKTEMWHILAAEPGAKIAAGFRQTLSGEELLSASLSGEIETLVEWYDAAPGDTFFIPAGTVHAIGAGLVLCEIQQHSDVTYRLYDYGRARELHLDHAVAVSRHEAHVARASPRGELLVSCDYFTTSLLRIERPRTWSSPDTPQLFIAIAGSGTIAGHPIQAGEVWEIPPQTPSFEIGGDVTLLHVR
ncbi:MAG TPA: class I mannose-6-phosphate isomerase [Bryobacteraceae bacterium]|nr:class I mannose-6-phosphate isomerase [Bryobacteraceae bacterium]